MLCNEEKSKYLLFFTLCRIYAIKNLSYFLTSVFMRVSKLFCQRVFVPDC